MIYPAAEAVFATDAFVKANLPSLCRNVLHLHDNDVRGEYPSPLAEAINMLRDLPYTNHLRIVVAMIERSAMERIVEIDDEL